MRDVTDSVLDNDSLDTFLEYCTTEEGLKEGEQVIQKENVVRIRK